ncbi:MAG: 30S ribosomal protein S9 [Candidatus Thermoplasmatota archaeon]|nr:30S ribosomal protein S9 [Candidatus Thermoplasmatota archaeon]
MKTIVENGKRKTALAKATIREGEGIIRFNSMLLEAVQNPFIRAKIREPLKLAGDKINGIDIYIKVNGGGYMGQAEAARTAVARGIVNYFEDEELKQRFLEYDRALFIDDIRQKEPKHYGGQGARAKRQKSYR